MSPSLHNPLHWRRWLGQCAMATTKAPWYDKSYENAPGRMEKYTNNEEPFLVEVMAIRTWQCLNGCVALDAAGLQACITCHRWRSDGAKRRGVSSC